MGNLTPKTPEQLKRIAKKSRQSKMKVLCSHIADAIGCNISTVYNDSSNGKFKLSNLKSISYYIVSMTAQDILKNQKDLPPTK